MTYRIDPATDRQYIEEFRKLMYEKIKEMHQVRYPYNNFLY